MRVCDPTSPLRSPRRDPGTAQCPPLTVATRPIALRVGGGQNDGEIVKVVPLWRIWNIGFDFGTSESYGGG